VNDDKYVYGTTAQLNDSTPHVVHTIKQGDTFDTLALYYYGNPTFYWIICDFNHIQDPYKELVVGEKLNIPTFSTIEYIL
jgi:nucleoid-associated protein YgaU